MCNCIVNLKRQQTQIRTVEMYCKIVWAAIAALSLLMCWTVGFWDLLRICYPGNYNRWSNTNMSLGTLWAQFSISVHWVCELVWMLWRGPNVDNWTLWQHCANILDTLWELTNPNIESFLWRKIPRMSKHITTHAAGYLMIWQWKCGYIMLASRT